MSVFDLKKSISQYLPYYPVGEVDDNRMGIIGIVMFESMFIW